MRTQIKQELLSTKRNEALTEWAAELKKKYDGKVSYATGFEPTTTEARDDHHDRAGLSPWRTSGSRGHCSTCRR